MKKSFLAIFLLALLPANAYESIRGYSKHQPYEYQKGYSYEKRCFRFEYRENYIPGTYNSPGYVKSYREKVSVPCGRNKRTLNHYYNHANSKVKYVNNNPIKRCTGSTTIGGLIGGGLAASLSKKDSYGWSIPLGAVLGAGIGNAGCK